MLVLDGMVGTLRDSQVQATKDAMEELREERVHRDRAHNDVMQTLQFLMVKAAPSSPAGPPGTPTAGQSSLPP